MLGSIFTQSDVVSDGVDGQVGACQVEMQIIARAGQDWAKFAVAAAVPSHIGDNHKAVICDKSVYHRAPASRPGGGATRTGTGTRCFFGGSSSATAPPPSISSARSICVSKKRRIASSGLSSTPKAHTHSQHTGWRTS